MVTKSALFMAAVLAPTTAFAQAWVPRAGDGTVAFVYQNQLVRDHLFSDGARIDAGHIESNSVLLDFTYGITDRFALNVNVPYIASAYHGSRPHPGSLLDDGKTHGTFQDFRADLRYNLMNKGIVLTPFVDVIVPSHRYDYFGHAVPGRRLAEAQIGTYVGHVLTRGLPGAFVQARVSYGFSQRPLARYHDRSNADGEIGYFINPRVRVFALTAAQYTFGGLEFTRLFPNDLTGDEFRHHDQIARSDLFDIGGGAQVQMTERTNLVASYARTIAGRSGHAAAHSVSIGISWSFGRSFDIDPLRIAEQKSQLPKCLCEKGTSRP